MEKTNQSGAAMCIEQEVELIRHSALLGTIKPEALKLLCFGSERLTFRPGQWLFHQGDAADAAYLVCSGQVQVSIAGAAGPVVLATSGPGDVLGEAGVLGGAPRTASAKAADEVTVLRIEGNTFRSVVRSHPDAALKVSQVLAARLARTTAELARLMQAQPANLAF